MRGPTMQGPMIGRPSARVRGCAAWAGAHRPYSLRFMQVGGVWRASLPSSAAPGIVGWLRTHVPVSSGPARVRGRVV